MQRFPVGFGVMGDEPCERGFAAAGWAVKDRAAQAIAVDQAAQEFARREQVLLADKLCQSSRPDAHGKRLHGLESLTFLFGEEVHDFSIEQF